jgi:hypothetical protein
MWDDLARVTALQQLGGNCFRTIAVLLRANANSMQWASISIQLTEKCGIPLIAETRR